MQNNLLLSKGQKTVILILLLSTMGLFGVSTSIVGVLLPQIIAHYTLPLSIAALLTVFKSIGGVAALMIGGVLAERLGKLQVILISIGLQGLSLYCTSMSFSYFFLLIIFFVRGISSSIINMICCAYIADLYPEKKNLYVNLVSTFMSIGCFIGPIYSNFLLYKGMSWGNNFEIIGILNLFILFAFCLYIFKEKNIIHRSAVVNNCTEKTGFLQFFHDKKVILICVLCFFYMGHHQSFLVWMPTYLNSKMIYTVEIINWLMSIFWVSVAVGRFAYGYLSKKINTALYFSVSGIVGTVTMLAGIFHNTIIVWRISIITLGVITGAVYPTAIALACDTYPECSGRITSVVCISALLGGMFFGWLFGVIVQYWSSLSAIIIVMTIPLLVVTLLGNLFMNKKPVVTKPQRREQ